MPKRLILHHDDADGRCAAAIAASHAYIIHRVHADLYFFPMDYGRKLDFGIFEGFEFDPYFDVWLLDFSLPVDEMERLEATVGIERLVWIDHHVTALEKLARFEHWAGLRRPDKAACALTWAYAGMFGGMPLAVKLIADRDTWKFEHGDQARWFHAALDLYDTHPGSQIWENFWLKPEERLEAELSQGCAIYTARRKRLAGVLASLGRAEKLHGTGLTVLSVNYPGSGDLGEIGRELGHEVVHSYVDQEKDGRLCRVHSLYSTSVDVGILAKERGGGGHRGAAGWVERI